MANDELRESGSGTADANGRAVTRVQPMRYGEEWRVTRMTVQSTSTTLVPTAKVYRGSEAASNLIDGTWTGTQDVSELSVRLMSGEALVCVFTGGDVGSVCTFNVFGEKVML